MLPIDTDKVYELFSFIVRGLYMYHWKTALDPAWGVDMKMFDPQREHEVIDAIMQKIGGIGQTVREDVGRRTFVYEAVRSAIIPQISLWQFSVFGGLELGRADSQGLRLSRFYAVTHHKDAGL